MSNRWTKSDIDFLEASYKNTHFSEIAEKLNKTQAAVTNQAWKLGLTGRKVSRKTVNRDEELLEYAGYGFKPHQIANIMGMKEDRVNKIIEDYRQ